MTHSLLLEGLKEARKLMDLHDGIKHLDALIAQHEADTIETTAVLPIVETRG